VRGDSASRLFAFVCFAESEEAKAAYAAIENKDIFSLGEVVYVNWAMKKSERIALL